MARPIEFEGLVGEGQVFHSGEMPSMTPERCQTIHSLEERLRTQTQQLAEGLLPDLEHLKLCLESTGLDFLASVAEHLGQERKELEETRRQLESSPDSSIEPARWLSRWQEERSRLEEHLSSLIPFLNQCQGHPHFRQLVDNGYATPAYQTAIWHLAYFEDRRSAAEICQLTGKSDFAQVLEDYASSQEAYREIRGRLVEMGTDPESPHKRLCLLSQRLDGLPKLHLKATQTRLSLALLREGTVWERLRQAPLAPQMRSVFEEASQTLQELEQARSARKQ